MCVCVCVCACSAVSISSFTLWLCMLFIDWSFACLISIRSTPLQEDCACMRTRKHTHTPLLQLLPCLFLDFSNVCTHTHTHALFQMLVKFPRDTNKYGGQELTRCDAKTPIIVPADSSLCPLWTVPQFWLLWIDSS